ncbi:Rrf2 family transcriptional regulator [bacterium]|nr:Rrf2 family transcriptional regulator [bacterium]
MISQSAEYALRAVVWLAQEPERSLGTGQIARAARVPPGYLAKVLQSLSRAGLVSSSPGRRGGFRLLKSPDSISVLEVIDAVDPIRRITTCPLGLPGHGEDLCPLHRRLDDAAQQMQAAFAGATIADLLNETTTSPPLREL